MKVRRRVAAGADLDAARAVQHVAGRANRYAVGARCQPRYGEAVATLRVADDGEGDVRTLALGADQDPFHGALLRRGHVAGERGRGLCVDPGHHRDREQQRDERADDQQ